MNRFFFSLLALLLACATPAQTQEAAVRDGRPALRFVAASGQTGDYLVQEDAEPDLTLRFFVTSPKFLRYCQGWLHVSAARVRLEPEQSCSNIAFDAPHSDVEYVKGNGYWSAIRIASKQRDFFLQGSLGVRDEDVLYNLFKRALQDFASAEADFRRLTGSLQSNPPARSSGAGAVAHPRLIVSLQPANVQVYVDDVFKGMTSAEGRLIIEGLAPGAHRVRMNLIGYTEAARTVELKPGETAAIEAKLEPAGPKPLALAEIEEALTNGLPPKGITKLVNQYGVDFALTKEIEQRLREKGADSDLLLAIATNKK